VATGLWTSVSGAAARAQAVDVVANNLANADTVGFKKDEPAFREYLSTLERESPGLEVPRKPFQDRDFHPLDGKDQAFVINDGTYTSFRQGHLKVTQSPLDVALDGSGFLEVNTPYGIRYTRQGSLKMATDGRLVTTEGYPVLASQPGGLAAATPATPAQLGQGGLSTQGGVAAGQNGAMDPALAARFVNVRDRGPITITEQGEIFAGEDRIAKLSVVEFADARRLRKSGGQLFENPDPANVRRDQPVTVVRQGMVETSNVNPIEEMTRLIQANRLFEQDLKAMKTHSELMGREVNDVGKL
jgi:flagellar basal-body rod protein FlgF